MTSVLLLPSPSPPPSFPPLLSNLLPSLPSFLPSSSDPVTFASIARFAVVFLQLSCILLYCHGCGYANTSISAHHAIIYYGEIFHPFNKLPLPHPPLLLYISLHVAIPLQTILGAIRNHVCAGIYVLCIGATMRVLCKCNTLLCVCLLRCGFDDQRERRGGG